MSEIEEDLPLVAVCNSNNSITTNGITNKKNKRHHSFDQLLRDSARLAVILSSEAYNEDEDEDDRKDHGVVEEPPFEGESTLRSVFRRRAGAIHGNVSIASLEETLGHLGAIFDDDDGDNDDPNVLPPLDALTTVYEQILSQLIEETGENPSLRTTLYLTTRLFWDPQCVSIRGGILEGVLVRLAGYPDSLKAVPLIIQASKGHPHLLVLLARTLHLSADPGALVFAKGLLEAGLWERRNVSNVSNVSNDDDDDARRVTNNDATISKNDATITNNDATFTNNDMTISNNDATATNDLAFVKALTDLVRQCPDTSDLPAIHRMVTLAQYRLYLFDGSDGTDNQHHHRHRHHEFTRLEASLRDLASKVPLIHHHALSIGIRDGLSKMQAFLRLFVGKRSSHHHHQRINR